MREKLSSSATTFYKLLLPLLWISGFGTAVVVMWRAARRHEVEDVAPWLFLMAWIVGSAAVLWTARRLKTVSLDGRNLYVSDYRREIVVPLDSVLSVDETWLKNPKEIRLKLYAPTDFGTTIAFIPKTRQYWPFRSHPIALKLRALVQRTPL